MCCVEGPAGIPAWLEHPKEETEQREVRVQKEPREATGYIDHGRSSELCSN